MKLPVRFERFYVDVSGWPVDYETDFASDCLCVFNYIVMTTSVRDAETGRVIAPFVFSDFVTGLKNYFFGKKR